MTDPGAGSGVLVVLVTAPDATTLEQIAERLVEERLAACVNVLPRVASVYRWRGSVHRDDEALGILKTTTERLAALERRLVELHPYEVPELLALEPVQGLPPYLDWLRKETVEKSDDVEA